MSSPLKFLFKYPCRGREQVFFESLDSLNNNIRDRENYHISLTLDDDDVVLNRPEVIERIMTYPNVSIEWGLSTSKIDAINRSMPDYDWGVILAWSNDMFATMFGFDDIMRSDMSQQLDLHDYDMLCHFPEPDTKETLNTLYMATRKYYNRFGYIYHPSYKSLWADNDTMSIAKMLNRYHFFGTPGLYVHRNPAYHSHGVVRDELFNHQQSLWQVDEDNYLAREKIKFGLNDSEIVIKSFNSGGRQHNFE